MKKTILIVAILLSLATLAFAESNHHQFTKDNALKVQENMTPAEIVDMFGKPDAINVESFGLDTKEGSWIGIVYTYHMINHDGNYFSWENNSFTFDSKTKKLWYWDINITY
jgi:hypothetical protein